MNPAQYDRRAAETARHPLLRLAGGAGIVGPILFLLVAITHGASRSDHNLVSMPISALAAGPTGWIQGVNFVVTGHLMIAFAAGLHRGLAPGRTGIMGPAFLAVSGVGLVWAGLFPATDATGGFQANALHTVGAFLAFPGAALGLLLLAPRLRGDPAWRGLAAYSGIAGLAVAVLFIAAGALAVPEGGPLHRYWGAAQLLIPAFWFPCIITLAIRLRRVAHRTTERTTGETLSYDNGAGPDRESTASTPRWVKVFGTIFLVVVLVFFILLFTRGPTAA